MTTRLYAIPLALVALAIIAFAAVVVAENIDPNNNNSQMAWGENVGWLNAEPANCGNCGVHVTNTGLTGYVWAENAGWINLSCQNNNTCSGPAGNWGVTNNGAGALSGYAWAENGGWINFSCRTNYAPACAGSPGGNWGVAISPTTGDFSGHAWAENLGWISFSDTSPFAYKVQTSDIDADGVFAGSDNCVAVVNAGQQNADGDAFGDACDACPATADASACTDDDNDGYTDTAEAGTPLCNGTGNEDGSPVNDDTAVNDGCPAVGPAESGGQCANNADDDADSAVNDGCPQAGSFSEAQFRIGTGATDPCGAPGWPSDPFSSGASLNRLTIQDVISFVSVPRKLDKNPGETGFDSRWDLVPGRGILGKFININDITALVNGTTGNPPMLGNSRAFDKTCPVPP
jgi:hypothetical protein